jgi:cyclase
MKKTLQLIALAALTSLANAQQPAPAAKPATAPKPVVQDKTPVNAFQIRDNMWMLVGDGGNVTMQVGDDGILLVDTGLVNRTDALLEAIRKISTKPIKYIINTHYHPDHVGGNEKIRAAGITVTGGNVAGDIGDAGVGAAIIAHEGTANRMSAPTGQQSAYPSAAWPTSTFFDEEKKLWFNGEPIQIFHASNSHTDGDVFVHFRKNDVIVTGDLFTTVMYPFVDVAAGGTINGWLKSLSRMIDIVVPVYGQDGGSTIIPGHGRVCDVGDLLNYREMATVIRDRVLALKKKGQTLAQVKAAKPSLGWDPRYAPQGSFVTGDAFVEAIFNTVDKK